MFRKWKSKTAVQKKLFLEAFLYIHYYQLIIKIFPFKKIIRLNRLEDLKTDLAVCPDSVEVIQIKWVIQAASKYLLFKPLCLNQALVAQRMLQKRNLKGKLFLGVGKDKENNSKMVAHAWLKYNDKIITGNGELERYAIVASYTWN